MNSAFTKQFGDVDSTDIEALVTSAVTEGQNLEFKKEPWGRGDEDVREMLRDISSMANAFGGHILIGVGEDDDGRATAIHEVPKAEEERDRILASCLANLQPRVTGLDIRTVDLPSGAKMLILKIPNSTRLHQITFKGLYQFWIRHDRQKTRMSFDEIRDAIIRGEEDLSWSHDFLKQRRKKHGDGALLLNAMPIKREKEVFNTRDEKIRELMQQTPGDRRSGWTFTFNQGTVRPTLHGLIAISDISSLELFRNGGLEGTVKVSEECLITKKRLHYQNKDDEPRLVFVNMGLVEFIYSFIKKVKVLTDQAGYDGPYSFSLSMFGIRGYVLPKERQAGHYIQRSFNEYADKDLEIDFETFDVVDPEKITKYLCDRIWQAFGFEEEPYYKGTEFDFSA